jgi:hypothetical protein
MGLLLRLIRSRQLLHSIGRKQKQFLLQQEYNRSFESEGQAEIVAPILIKLALKIRFLLTYLFLFGYIIFCPLLWALLKSNPGFNHFQDLAGVLASLLALLIYPVIVVSLPAEEVHIDQNGIGNMRKEITWQECTHFLCYKVPQLFGTSLLYYEIVGKRTSILWRRVDGDFTSHYPLKPTVPLLLHQQQLQQIIRFVFLRTGLPLYDLSGPEPVQIYPPREQIQE